jgi:hypothetical protein
MAQTDVSKRSGLSEKAAATLAQFPGPVTLRPSKLKWSVLIIANASYGIACMVLSPWLYLQTGITIGVVSGFFVGILGTLGATIAAFSLITKRMWAKLDADGFETRNLWGGRKHRRWRDTDEFTERWVSAMPYTVYNDITPSSGWWDRLNRAYIGGKSLLPDTYGLGAKNLAYLMMAWRQRALALAR